MKVPLSWLGDYIDVGSIGVDRLAESLTMAGLEVEEIDNGPSGPVFVTKVTPNRGDWMSIAGVAREARAALGLGTAKAAGTGSHLPGAVPEPQAWTESVPIRIDVPQWCPRYAVALVEIASVGSSPPWMQERLLAAGMRPINAVVDVANYVMIELGQPLHTFDLDKVAGPEIIVRAARAGEGIVTLDGRRRELNPQIMVIADTKNPAAIAGIMGGRDSEVTDATRRVLIESAHFDPARVRAAAKALDLSTDASYRFERHVDPGAVGPALSAAAAMIAQFTGGRAAPGFADIHQVPQPPRTIGLRLSRAQAVLGIAPEGDKPFDALRTLGFGLVSAASPAFDYDVLVPSHRPDVVREIDVIEELGRMIGYAALPEIVPPARSSQGGRDSEGGLLTSRFRDILVGQGLTEAYSHTLGGPSAFDEPSLESERVHIRTALSSELSVLRQRLIPGLIAAVGHNARLRTDIALFEIGKVFSRSETGVYCERLAAAAVIQGDYFAAKGIAENVFRALGLEFPQTAALTKAAMHPHRCASLVVDGVAIGFVAEVDPGRTAEHLDLPSTFGRIACFELDIDRVGAYIPDEKRYRPLPRFPELTRDLAMLFPVDTPYGEIARIAAGSAGDFIENITLLSIYTGERIEPGRKSVAVRFTMRAPDRTLTDADADAALSAAQSALSDECGASIR